MVHPDKPRFIPTRSTAIDICKLFFYQQIPSDNMGDRAILSLDSAKVFNSMEWPYLWEVLSHFSLGEHFIGWVKILYSAPQAAMLINGSQSDPFPLYRGNRQGFPLSPLLFTLAVEPLAVTIRQSDSIVGFRRGKKADRIVLNANDALLFLGDTGASLTFLMSTILIFGSFSAFTIHWNKSVLPLESQQVMPPQCAQQIKIVSSFKYLGVWIHLKVEGYLQHNLWLLLERFKLESKTLCKFPLSVAGQTNLIKMIWAL